MLTPEMIMRIMNECLTPFTTEWYVADDRDMTFVDIGDGWIDLIKAAELLNAEFYRSLHEAAFSGPGHEVD
jgi:hypothetical protein